LVAKGYSPTKDHPQPPRGHWERIPRLIPTRSKESSYPVLLSSTPASFLFPSLTFSATKGQVATTAEENLERLANAGFLVEDLIPICFNCNTKGHGKSECPNPPEGSLPPLHLLSYGVMLIVERVRAAPIVSCINCGEEGHRMRDCTKERQDFSSGMVCRNCKYSPSPLI